MHESKVEEEGNSVNFFSYENIRKMKKVEGGKTMSIIFTGHDKKFVLYNKSF